MVSQTRTDILVRHLARVLTCLKSSLRTRNRIRKSMPLRVRRQIRRTSLNSVVQLSLLLLYSQR